MELLILLFISSPGDSVGWTYIDIQSQANTRQMVWFDGASGTHVDFQCAHEPFPYDDRHCAYNFKLNGSWYGDVWVSSGLSGCAVLGVKPSNNAAVCCYQMQVGGDIYRCWVSVDRSQGGYDFTEHPICPQNMSKEILWPALAVDDQNNFHWMGRLYHPYAGTLYYARSTDDGYTWTDPMVVDSFQQQSSHAYDIFADRFRAPGKVVMVWLKENDVWINLSTDYGMTWQGPQNITQFSPAESIRVWNDCRPIFDQNGDPHVVFTVVDTINPYQRSWIMHWSPKTGLTFVTKPWELLRLPLYPPCHRPTLVIDRDNYYLYCIFAGYSEGDTSQHGAYNGDIYGKVSTDGGFTWFSNVGDSAVNITRSKSPGAPPGQCHNDEFPSVHPYIEMVGGRKTLIISYLEDKDPGNIGETRNPLRVYFYPVDSILPVGETAEISPLAELVNIFPNPSRGVINIEYTLSRRSRVKISLFDITGRMVDNLLNRILDAGNHRLIFRLDLPSGLYFIQMETVNYRKVVSLIFCDKP